MLPHQQDTGGEESDGHHRLVEDRQHLAAHMDGSQFPLEVESAATLLVHSCGFGLPAQFVGVVPFLLKSITIS